MAKRILDIVGALFGLAVLSPMFAVVSILIWRRMGRPVLFRQLRPGKNGDLFELVKFRTMRDAVDSQGMPLSDAERMTRLGRILRATSLDEFPELWNVLKGDMSLVGPRPLLVDYLPLYTPDQARRHDVRPGITGWVQVNGRNTVGWEDKFELDKWYVENQSFWLDIKILFLTVKKVLVRDGISAEGEATMPRFEGSNADTETLDSEREPNA